MKSTVWKQPGTFLDVFPQDGLGKGRDCLWRIQTALYVRLLYKRKLYLTAFLRDSGYMFL